MDESNIPAIYRHNVDETVTDEQVHRALRSLGPVVRYTNDTKTVKKQKTLIRVLKKEHKELVEKLEAIEPAKHVKDSDKITADIENLLNEKIRLETDIEKKKGYISDLNNRISTTNAEILAERKKNRNVERFSNVKRIIESLENKLNISEVKLGETHLKNRKLREEIDSLLAERSNFNSLYDQQLKHLELGKKEMNRILQEAVHFYSQREKEIIKLEKLKERDAQWVNVQSKEMNDLKRKKSCENYQQSFNISKSKTRTVDVKNIISIDSTEHRNQMKLNLTSYLDLLNQIKEMYEPRLNGEGLKQLVYIYSMGNEELYQMLLYNNELNCELEVYQSEENKNISKYMERVGNNIEEMHRRRLVLADMKTITEKNQSIISQMQSSLNQHLEDLETILLGIQNLFTVAECSDEPLLLLLGESKNVTKYNFKFYLKTIEEKILTLIGADLNWLDKERQSQATFVDEKNSGMEIINSSRRNTLLPNKRVITQPCSICKPQNKVQNN